jgi:hypothetical protein
MNAPVLPEMLVQRGERPQGELPLASEGVLRYVWESRFGPMLIEVRQGRAYVIGSSLSHLWERAGVRARPSR